MCDFLRAHVSLGAKVPKHALEPLTENEILRSGFVGSRMELLRVAFSTAPTRFFAGAASSAPGAPGTRGDNAW